MSDEGKIVEKKSSNPFEIQVEKTQNDTQPEKPTFKATLKKILSYVFIDGLSGMAIGLFATLIIGTIIDTVGDLITSAGGASVGIYFVYVGQIAQFLMGFGIALGMGYKLKKSPLVSISAGVVGFFASFCATILTKGGAGISVLDEIVKDGVVVGLKTSVGEPLTAFIASFVALEVGSLVSGKTKVDIIVTPLVSVFSGALIAFLLSLPISEMMAGLRWVVAYSSEQQPVLMGILVSVIMGVCLTLPISSAAIGVMLSLSGNVAGAAVVGCCCHMVGYAVMSFRENKWGGLVAQGLGTSMLQMPNLVKKPLLWLPPVIASAILGPIGACLLNMQASPAGSGMGTAGLVGIIETFSVMCVQNGEAWWLVLIKIVSIDIVAPAVLCLIISEIFRKVNWIKYGDLKLDL